MTAHLCKTVPASEGLSLVEAAPLTLEARVELLEIQNAALQDTVTSLLKFLKAKAAIATLIGDLLEPDEA